MLYIFVVCVIALKGANLDLTEVIQKEKVVEKEYADSLKKILDSLLALGLVPEIKFDTSKKFTNPEELRKQLEITRQQLIAVQQQNPSLTVSTTSPSFTTTNPNLTPEEIKRIEEQKKEEQIIEPKEVQEIRIGNPVIVQFAQNTMNNPYDQPLEIVGITTIPPKGSKTFITGGEGSVTLKVGTTTKTVQTKPNDKPKISLQRLVPAGENVSIRSIQGTVGYRITIKVQLVTG